MTTPARRTTSTALVRPLAALAGSAALLLATAPAATAHDELVSAVPGTGTTVLNVPEAVSLGFSDEPLELGLQVVVTGPDGAVVSEGPPEVVGTDVVQGLGPDRPAGSYAVDWRVTSQDGHPIEGRVTFTAEQAVVAAPAEDTTGGTTGSTADDTADGTGDDTGDGTADDTGAASAGGISGSTWAWTAAAGLAGAALGVVLLRARGRAQRP